MLLTLFAACTLDPIPSDLTDHASEVASRVDAERLRAGLVDLFEAHSSDEGRHHSANARSYLRERLGAASGWSVRTETDDAEPPSTNLVVERPGRVDRWVMLTAHYDAFFGGANDNGSGVSALLELTEVLETDTELGVRIVLFDTEELGLVGSERYFALHGVDDVVAMLNLDCVGSYKEGPGSQVVPLGFRFPEEGTFIANYGNGPASDLLSWGGQVALGVVDWFGVDTSGAGRSPALAGMRASDHAHAWDAGLPALMVTDTVFLRWDEIHTEDDTLEVVDAEFHAAVTSWAAAMTTVLTSGELEP